MFTATGIMLGVAALTVVLSVMGGFEKSLRERVLSLTPQIQVQSYEGSIAGYAAMQRRIGELAGVSGSDPFIVGQAMISSAHGIGGVVVRGVEPNNPVVVEQLGRYIVQGGLSSLGRRQGPSGNGAAEAPLGALAIGRTLAAKLGVRVGDTVNLVAPIISASEPELATRTGRFAVGAIFQSGIEFVDHNLVFMELGNAQSFFGREDRIDGIEVRLVSLDATRRVTAELRKLFAYPYRVSNWMEFNQAASAGFAMLKRVYALVLLMLIGVAAFNLVATLIMVVMEKRKDIAVLMAMGATRRDVRLIFVFKGLIVGAAGTAAGLAVGALGCFALAHYRFIHIPEKIYGVSTLPIAVAPLNFALVAVASLMLCLLATVYPARQASRELPIELFRA